MTDYEKEKQERRARWKKRRRKQTIRNLSLCGVAIGVIVACIFCIVILSNRMHSKETVGKSVESGKIIKERPELDVKLLDINEYSRPGIAIGKVNGIVVHYTANPGTTARQNRDYFQGLAQTGETHASSHFVIGLDGEIVQCIPCDEMAYASNNRNSDTIAIECCIPDTSGKFNVATYDSLVWLTSWLIGRYQLSVDDVIRHYDVTGKSYQMRLTGMALGAALTCFVFYRNHKNRTYKRNLKDLIQEFDITSSRTKWQICQILCVPIVLCIAELCNMPRAMWAGIAAMSTILPFMEDMHYRVRKRIVGNIAGVICFTVLYFLLPSSIYAYIGILGGIGVGFSAQYGWQAVFNTFGALAIAAETYGLQGAVSLRVIQNVFGVVFALAFCVIFYWFMSKKEKSSVSW